MPRVKTVQKAQKDYPAFGIKKGEKYYWWKFRYGGKRMSKTYPKASQLTQSAFLGTIYDLNDRLSSISVETVDDLQTEIDDIKSSLEELRDEQEEKRNNMPEQLQYAPTGELLQERYDALDEMINELESVDLDFYCDEDDLRETATAEFEDEDEEYGDDQIEARVEELRSEKELDFVNEKIEEINQISYGGS